MKKTLKFLLTFISLMLLCSLLAGCGGGDVGGGDVGGGDIGGDEGWKPTGADVVLMENGAPSDCVYIFADGDSIAESFATELRTELINDGLRGSDSAPYSSAQELEAPNAHEIVIGRSNRDVSVKAAAFLDEKIAATPDDFHWVFHYYDGSLAIIATDAQAYEFALEEILDTLVVSGKLTFKDTLKYHGTYSREQYDRELQEKYQAMKEAAEALVNEQRESFASQNVFGSSTADISTLLTEAQKTKWGTAPQNPINEHPRLMFTKADIPGIRAALEDNTATNKLFKTYMESDVSGILRTLPAYSGSGNSHNYDTGVLTHIACKALAYQVYGIEAYGYQALYAMKNYLNTLNIQYISGDQYRQFGDVLFYAACVYDWCYDIMNDVDKAQMIAAVENRICNTTNYKGVSFEIGFPPTEQASFVGHGAEYQLLRDYLSISIAIYDENPSWYNYVGARFFNDFVPTRNVYFEPTGIAHQGTNYLTMRHAATLYSAWMANVALGGNPYKNLLQTMYSFASYEYVPGYIFCDGDSTNIITNAGLRDAEFFVGYMFDDATMIAQAESILGTSALKHSTQGLSCSIYVILRGKGTQPAENRYENMDLILYNGSPLGQYVIREAWGVEDSAALFMKMTERNSANHDHPDAGHFQIYYKGMLTNDGGVYDNYGHVHTKYYHKGTIAHNSLLIYDGSKYNTTSDDGRYYTGGQTIKQKAPSSAEDWLDPKNDGFYKSSELIGHQHAYLDGDETKPLYAYLAGNMAAAYDRSAVNYVGRRMLAVYTFDEDFPLVFFVYDDIESKKAGFEKIFLLQITSPEEPEINTKKKTVITENGDGRLVLTCLSDDASIRGVGGRSYNADGTYNAEKSKNYIVNGKQLISLNKKDDGHWGRVEITAIGKANSSFMNVLYVTDKGQEKVAPAIKKVTGDAVDGGTFGDIAAIFATSRERVTDTLTATVTGSGDMNYYVSGVAAGTWNISVDGTSYGTATATEDGGLLTFTAPAGTLVITAAK